MLQAREPNEFARASSHSSSPHSDGPLFLGLALLAGFAGGLMAFLTPHSAAGWSETGLRHGLLLDFFVIAPAFLGGLGRLLLPAQLKRSSMALPGFDHAGIALLATGLALLLSSEWLGATCLLLAVLAWAGGMFAVSIGTIASVLEDRPDRFRALSPFVWSQFLTASAFIVVLPVLAAGVVRIGLGAMPAEAALDRLLHVFRVPELALSILPALGIAADMIFRRDRNVPALLTGIMALMSLGTAIVWTHGVINGVRDFVPLEIFGVAVPTLVLIAAFCFSLWSVRSSASLPLFWSFGALLLFSAGWLLRILPQGQTDLHSAALFGAIFALFGGCYRWLQEAQNNAVPRWVGMVHQQITALGVVCSFLPMAGLHHFGEAVMGVSLLCAIPLAWRITMAQREQKLAVMS
ncbi:heme-copper oxidase family protein [Kozakia baliensis]|uniref:cbb3-type cytochrome c oxidase subunit I n=1 Tax=Kozakia baliensis TaxID=153496 RepID=UPI001268D0F2|nr:cbb3-type cytochrome c oxidase subunit I [Kozakia baliensis]